MRPMKTMIAATRNSGMCLSYKYLMLASGSQRFCKPSGYLRTATEKISFVFRSNFVYDSSITVVSVAMGFRLPISLANLDEYLLIRITMMRRMIR